MLTSVNIYKFLSRRPWIVSRRVSQWWQFYDMNKSFLSLARTVKDYFRLASLFIQWSSNKLMVSWMKWITFPLVPIFLLYFRSVRWDMSNVNLISILRSNLSVKGDFVSVTIPKMELKLVHQQGQFIKTFTRHSVIYKCCYCFHTLTKTIATLVNQGHPTEIFPKISVRKTIWELEFSEHLL